MKLPKMFFVLCGLVLNLHGQETAATSDTAATPAPVPVRPAFVIQSAVCKKMMAVEPAPLPGMVPVQKEITINQYLVDDPELSDPGFADPVPPVRVIPTAESIALRKAFAASRPKRIFVELHVTVYDHQRTLLSWHPQGSREQEMVAWSAIDFNVMRGTNRFSYGGVDYQLMIGGGIINDSIAQRQRLAEHRGVVYQPPVIPELPPAGTPVFVVTKGDASDTAALAPITALHELYKADSASLIAKYEAREQAEREQKAYIRAHPPEPKDVTIYFWERSHPVGMSADTIKKEENR